MSTSKGVSKMFPFGTRKLERNQMYKLAYQYVIDAIYKLDLSNLEKDPKLASCVYDLMHSIYLQVRCGNPEMSRGTCARLCKYLDRKEPN
jgi:hypothetical protein